MSWNNEILAEKWRLIENTETLSELSKTIDEIDHKKSYYGNTLNNFNISNKLKDSTAVIHEINENQISKIENKDDTFEGIRVGHELEHSNNDINLDTTQEVRMINDASVENINKSLTHSDFEVFTP